MNNHRKYYTTSQKAKTIIFILVVALMLMAAAILAVSFCKGDDMVTCWIMCKPGDYVNVRRTPSKNGMEVGRLDCGDGFLTDGTSSNGWIRVYGIGEYGEGWVYCGYVSIYEPRIVGETYVCVAQNRVACRRWMDGPKAQNPWLRNGSLVQVFVMTDEWAVTSRGYIRSEYLEVSPQ